MMDFSPKVATTAASAAVALAGLNLPVANAQVYAVFDQQGRELGPVDPLTVTTGTASTVTLRVEEFFGLGVQSGAGLWRFDSELIASGFSVVAMPGVSVVFEPTTDPNVCSFSWTLPQGQGLFNGVQRLFDLTINPNPSGNYTMEYYGQGDSHGIFAPDGTGLTLPVGQLAVNVVPAPATSLGLAALGGLLASRRRR